MMIPQCVTSSSMDLDTGMAYFFLASAHLAGSLSKPITAAFPMAPEEMSPFNIAQPIFPSPIIPILLPFKYRTAYPHYIGTLLDGYLKILRHPHREIAHAYLIYLLSGYRLGGLSQSLKIRPCLLGIQNNRRHRHQPHYLYIRQCRRFLY